MYEIFVHIFIYSEFIGSFIFWSTFRARYFKDFNQRIFTLICHDFYITNGSLESYREMMSLLCIKHI